MFLEETTDGNVYMLQFVRRGSGRFWYYVGTLIGLIFAAVFFSMAITVFSQDNGTAIFMGVIGATILLAVIIIRHTGIQPVFIMIQGGF